MSISHDANEILVSGTETGDALRTYMNTNSLGTVHDRTAILDRNINLDTDASFTDHDCTWIFPSTYHWNFNKNPQPTLFELEDAVIVYTDGAKSHSDQPRAETLRLINVQYRIEGNTGRTDFFGAGTTIGFDFSNVQFITYGGTNYLHLETSGGLLEDVAVKVGAGNLIYQPDTIDNTTLILRNWTLDSKINLIQANGGASLNAITRLENLSWGKTIWYIGTGGRGQHYKVINPIKPSGWRFYKGSTDTTNCRCDEYHTHNVRIVDEDNNALSGFPVHLRRSDGTVVYELTTDSNGDIAEQEVMTYEQTGQTGAHTGADFTQYNGFSLAGISYSNKLVSGVKNLADGRIDEVIGSFTDATITDTKVTADDYQEIDTPQKFYNRAKAYLVDNFAGETATIVSRAGSEIDLGSYNLTIDSNASSVFAFDGTTITIKASTFVGNLTTTGVITLNNATVSGRYTDSTGESLQLPWVVSNVEATSSLQLWNMTKNAEVISQVVPTNAPTNAASWSPLTLSPTLWFDADDASTITASGSSVTAWNDKSGNNDHPTTLTNVTQSGTIGGKNTMTFGTTSIMTGGSSGWGWQESIIVAEYTGGSTFHSSYSGLFTGGTRYQIVFLGYAGTNHWYNFTFAGMNQHNVNGSLSAWSGQNNTNIINELSGGGLVGLNANSATTLDGWTIGQQSDFNDRGWVGKIAEVLTFSSALSSSDREKVEGYLAHKWGFTSKLPTNHTYRVTAPGAAPGEVVTAPGEVGEKVSVGGTYTAQQISSGDNIRLRITCQAGVEALLPYEAYSVANDSGLSFQADQKPDLVYNGNGIDGSLVSTLTADYPNVQIDISDGDGVADTRELYAFAVYQSTTFQGIDKWFNAITPIDAMNYRINTANADIKLQNRGSIPLVISGARIFRSDGTSVLHADAGDKPMTQDTGELLQYIKPQVEAALNSNAKISSTNNNSKLIPGLFY